MSWMRKLYETYDFISKKDLPHDKLLTPIGHTVQTAHIVITLSESGCFRTAHVLPPKTNIILPATENSENRTSGEAPHPLADKIQYVAKDYADYGGHKKAYFEGYLAQLEKWCHSEHGHPKVKAVLEYVRKGQVVADLVRANVLPVDNHQFLTKWNQQGEVPDIFNTLPKSADLDFGSALVCWQVESDNDPQTKTWLDHEIHQSWIDYLKDQSDKTGFCIIQGKVAPLATMHPAKLRHTGDKAKLISSNDTSGYTFRGRAYHADDLASISREASAKAHSALRWLIDRQGIRNGDQVIVTWAVSGADVPQVFIEPTEWIDDWDNPDFSPQYTANTDQTRQAEHTDVQQHSLNIGYQAAKLMKRKLHGYQAGLSESEQLSLLVLDSATPGRAALTYYQEFLPKDYFANLDAWIDDFSWYQRYSIQTDDAKKSQKNRIVWGMAPPSPYTVFEAVYGKSADKDGKIKKQLYTRLLPVISGGPAVNIPYDLVRQSFQTACNPNGYEHWEWERNIGVACSLYRGYCARHQNLSQRRSYDMSLDLNNCSRDYLYGRLLAIAENIESYALRQAGEKRSTTAERYMQRFAERPFSTWRNIELALTPYQERLRNHGKDTGSQAIGEIMELFDGADFVNDSKLSGEFLLGYHCQKMAIAKRIAELSNKSNND
ncbi:type I-C CRISPR-associated protein Cas8c/Csd1 [Neisseria sp. ZJ106]|uniref:Type I-C CRISPR-associated protein Cas8c/Csd1 n=1 Tax=Neisseria lisongii TaxID=2912188 RepID=A0ABY7RL77_9NEIS|nr:type I-C CRISPR-associated protein Cas8c/Csd1 [Neisseria lisongii]MCF7521448.1 type I-C CRISPR-associated protein Cas8c/Csd1 [Neisseria lisongii]WCL72301.1 type I-C CRISPR-associated protein Cas8c/Csd1 [Neisseria lisongii]